MDNAAIQSALTSAMQALQQNKPQDMDAALDPIIAITDAVPDAFAMKAVASNMQGKRDEAIDFAKRALKVVPDNANYLGTLATVYLHAGRADDAIETFQTLVGHHPDQPQAFFALGGLLIQRGKFDDAIAAFEALARLAPNQPAVYLNLASAHYEAQHYGEALEPAMRAAKELPDVPDTHYTLGKVCLANGHPEQALKAFDALKGNDLFALKSLAYREVALRELGRDDEANAISRLDDYVFAYELEVPEGFASIQDFNAALTQELTNHARIEDAPSHRATRNGQKVSYLLHDPSPLMKAFGIRIEQAIRRMQKHLEANASDGPFPTSPPGRIGIELWANIMHRQGHQLPHFHPEGWLSGCYYAKIPERVESSGEAHEGWIEFGRPAYHIPHKAAPKTKFLKPEPGMIVMFPSFMFHHTIPFDSDETRISCAFDVIPHEWASEYRKRALAGEV